MTLDVLRAVIVAHESDTHRRHASADDAVGSKLLDVAAHYMGT